MIWFLWEECGIECSQPTVSRFLKSINWSKKVGQRISQRQDSQFRQEWRVKMIGLRAEQLIFVDESSFNQTTGWRRRVWGPVGSATRYHTDIRRGRSWSILPAYTYQEYLPCTGVKEGYFNADDFYEWITTELLPLCEEGKGNIIVMDNNSTHVNTRVEEAIVACWL